MEFKALAVQTEAFEFNEDLHVSNAEECEVDFDLNVKVHNGQIVSVMDMQYYRTADPVQPLASLRTSIKLWVSPNQQDIACSERVLYLLKMQHRYSCFQIYQKLKPLQLQNFFLPTPSDEEFFKVVKAQAMAGLVFDESGRYSINF